MDPKPTKGQRDIIREYADARNCRYKITCNGEVYFYGLMPNTSSNYGWYFMAHSPEDAIRELSK